jgi:hypothetical protein
MREIKNIEQLKRIFHRLLFILFFFSVIELNAQTGIGTTTPNASAKLDVFSNNKGFLPPRVSLTDIYDQTTIVSPATGLLVYCKGDAGLVAGYYYWNGNAWATIATAGGSGSFASSYLRGSRISTQTIAVGGIVTFTNIDNSAGTDISLNTSTGKITLAAGNTYRIRGAVPNFSAGQRPSFIWYNETTSTNIGGATFAYNPGDAAALGAFGAPAELIITPNVSTVISLRLLSSLSSTSVTVGANGDFPTTGSYPWFDIQVISGNAPVTGQSVDYISVSRTTDLTVNTGDVVKFNSINSGNIPYDASTGKFSLTAGKTYRLSASISLSNGNSIVSEASVVWKNAAGDALPNKAEILSSSHSTNAGGNAFAEVIYTPTVNTTVNLYVAYATSNAMLWNSYTYANIEQIGSSAFVNPWTLAGTSTYNINGNVGIGTSSPDATSVLDLTSTNKGLLAPRVALTAKSGTSSPIASPTTGLLVYNTASAGTGGDAVTPGYYYFNGTFWTRIDPEGWSTGVPVTFGAPSGSTAPTKGTTSFDYVRYRNIGGKEYEVEYNYVQNGAGNSGIGDYLISLPSSLQFDFNALGQNAYTGATSYNAIINKITNSVGDLFYGGGHNSATVIPYDATRFRIHTNNWGTVGWTFFNSNYYQLNSPTSGFKMTFKFKAL